MVSTYNVGKELAITVRFAIADIDELERFAINSHGEKPETIEGMTSEELAYMMIQNEIMSVVESSDCGVWIIDPIEVTHGDN